MTANCGNCKHWDRREGKSWVAPVSWRNKFGLCKRASLSHIADADKESNVGFAFAACEMEGGYASELYTRPEFYCLEHAKIVCKAAL